MENAYEESLEIESSFGNRFMIEMDRTANTIYLRLLHPDVKDIGVYQMQLFSLSGKLKEAIDLRFTIMSKFYF